jgi:putative flippase GtrA
VRMLRTKAGLPAPSSRARVRGAALSLIAALVATALDFALALFLVSRPGLSPVLATAAGSALGALANFLLNRIATFRSSDAPLPQFGRYALVSAGSLGLNAGGVGLLLSLPGLPYPLAWWLVRTAVFMFWNYPLHEEYVFAPRQLAHAKPGQTRDA